MDGTPLSVRTDASAGGRSATTCPLILDLEGALLRSDPLFETALVYIRPNPFRLLRVMWWFAKGRAQLEHELAGVAEAIDVPPAINEELAQYAAAAAMRGHPIYAVTARDARLINGLTLRLPFLTGIITTACGTSRESENKAAALASRFADGFDYVDDPDRVLSAWHFTQSPAAIEPASRSPEATAHLSSIGTPTKAPSQFREFVKALRPHQWVKNLLVFVPIVLAGRFADLSALASAIVAFAAIGIIASATYLINDMWDLVDDRAHWSKRHRPLASGRLLISRAAVIAPIAISIGLVAGMMVSPRVVALLILYLVVTLAYTFGLKRILLIDGVVLSALYTVRVGLGIVAANAEPSLWLLVFSMFFFASLTYAKRYTEIAHVVRRKGDLINGRGYRAADAPLVATIGFVTGAVAVLAMHLYILHDALAQTFYGSPTVLWSFPLLMLGLIARIWFKSYRGEMDDDPVYFVLKDGLCMAVVTLMAACFVLAWLGPKWM